VTTVDIEAIRDRAAHVTEALDRLVSAPNPGHAGRAHAAAVASASDVPLLLNEIERIRERLMLKITERDEARSDLKEADAEIDRLVREVRNLRG
jgi:hypothetical protein